MNKFKQFLDIALNSELSINSKLKIFFGKKITYEVVFNSQETKEEFESKISNIKKYDISSKTLTSIFTALIPSDLSARYSDTILSLLDKVKEKDIINIFEDIVKHDNLTLCEAFLNSPDKKYNRLLFLDDDYAYYLSKSVEFGAKNITEYFLKNTRFVKLLLDPAIATQLLSSCLSTNNIEIANILLSHQINLNPIKEEIAYQTNLGNILLPDYYKSEVMQQIKKKLIHDDLTTDLPSQNTNKHKLTKI